MVSSHMEPVVSWDRITPAPILLQNPKKPECQFPYSAPSQITESEETKLSISGADFGFLVTDKISDGD